MVNLMTGLSQISGLFENANAHAAGVAGTHRPDGTGMNAQHGDVHIVRSIRFGINA